jgi:hypothetical protein
MAASCLLVYEVLADEEILAAEWLAKLAGESEVIDMFGVLGVGNGVKSAQHHWIYNLLIIGTIWEYLSGNIRNLAEAGIQWLCQMGLRAGTELRERSHFSSEFFYALGSDVSQTKGRKRKEYP